MADGKSIKLIPSERTFAEPKPLPANIAKRPVKMPPMKRIKK